MSTTCCPFRLGSGKFVLRFRSQWLGQSIQALLRKWLLHCDRIGRIQFAWSKGGHWAAWLLRVRSRRSHVLSDCLAQCLLLRKIAFDNHGCANLLLLQLFRCDFLYHHLVIDFRTSWSTAQRKICVIATEGWVPIIFINVDRFRHCRLDRLALIWLNCGQSWCRFRNSCCVFAKLRESASDPLCWLLPDGWGDLESLPRRWGSWLLSLFFCGCHRSRWLSSCFRDFWHHTLHRHTFLSILIRQLLLYELWLS